MYWTRLVLVRPAASLYSASPLKHHPTGDIYTENIRVVSQMAGLQMEGIFKWRGLKSQEELYVS